PTPPPTSAASAPTGPTASPTSAPTASPTAPPTSAPTAPASEPAKPPPPRPDVEAVRAKTAKVRALLDGTLDPAEDPPELFDVAIHDPRAVDVEAARLRKVLAKAPAPAPPEDGAEDAGAKPPDG